MKLRNVVLGVVLAGYWLLLSGWGYKGHEIIGKNSALSFNEAMVQFDVWIPVLTSHSADADKRKSSDNTEGVKHYIDIDNYPEFVENGSISQNLDTLIALHGRDFILDQGILPWATIRAFDTLVSHFETGKFEEAALIAADLSHYVADGHMPLHLTANYDGQLSGNNGIHSRYESTMIGKFASQLIYEGGEISCVDDVSGFIFRYIYENNQYVDSLINADNYAKSVNASTSSSAYSNALWEMTGDLTIDLFDDASFSLAELIYTAWVKAGSPSFDVQLFSEKWGQNNTHLSTVYFEDSLLKVDFELTVASQVSFDVFNLKGEKLFFQSFGHLNGGNHQIQIPLEVSKGLYLMVFNCNGSSDSIKFNVD